MRALLCQLVALLCVSGLATQQIPAQAATGSAARAVFLLPSGEQTATSLNGLWRFSSDDNPHFSETHYDDSDWALLRSDQSWTAQGHGGLRGFAWYRFEIEMPAGGGNKSLLLPGINSGYQCFFDGQLIRTEGFFPPVTARYSMPDLIELPTGSQTSAETHTVALRVWFDPRLDGSDEGGPDGSSVSLSALGSTELLKGNLSDFLALRRQRATVEFGLALLFLLAGTMCLPLFLIQRSSREYLWYWIAATSFGLDLALSFDRLSRPWHISTFLLGDALLNTATACGLTLFFCYLLRVKRGWLVWVILAANVLSLPFYWLQNVGAISAQTSYTVLAFSVCLYSGWVIAIVALRAWQRTPEAMLLLLPVANDFGILFVSMLQLRFPTFGEPVMRWAQFELLTYPFPVRIANLSAALVLLAFVGVLLARFVRIRRQHNRILADMDAARSIQHLLIPDVIPAVSGLRIEAAYYPALEVGGDFFQVIPSGTGKTLIVLGDVSGKGLPAAMTVSLVVGVLHTLVEFTTSPGAILAALNKKLMGRGAGFTTCLAMEIGQDGTLIFANAGQLAPYRNGVEIASEAGLPLGLFADVVYPEAVLRLAAGDRLTLMTDGIPEATSDRELFGFTRTEELSQQSADHIAKAAQRFGQTDDITVLSIDFLAATQTSSA